MPSSSNVGVTSAFIFIAGAEGSGTTMLLRLLSSPDCASSLGGNNYIKVPDAPEARELASRFDQVNRQVWDRGLSMAEARRARSEWTEVLGLMRRSVCFAGQTHLLFKRSLPFGGEGGRRTPDLWDVLDLDRGARFIAVYREPAAACFSAFRRGFDNDLRRLAVVCSEQLTSLAAQIAAVGPERARIVSYERLCDDPLGELTPLFRFCGLPTSALADVVSGEKVERGFNDRHVRELDRDTLAWLEAYFHPGRRKQWALLEASRTSPSPEIM